MIRAPRILIRAGHRDWTRKRREILSLERGSRSQGPTQDEQEASMDSLETIACSA